MLDRRLYLRRCAGEVYIFLILYSFASLPFFFVGEDTLLWGGLFCFFPFMCLFFLRTRVKKLWSFLVASLLLVGWPLLLPITTPEKACLVIFMVVCWGWNFHKRINTLYTSIESTTLIGSTCFLLAIGLASLFFSWSYGIPLQRVLPLLVVSQLIILLVGTYSIHTASLDSSLFVFEKNSAQPIGHIIRFNNRAMLLFLLLLLVCVGVAAIAPVSSVFAGLGAFLMLLIRRALSALFSASQEEEAPTEENSFWDDVAVGAAEEAKPNPILEFILALIYHIVQVALIIAAVLLLVLAIYRLYKRFLAPEEATGPDLKHYIGPEISVSSLSRPFKRLRERLPHFGQTEAQRIRKRYYKAVKAEMRKGKQITAQDTAQMIHEKLPDNSTVNELTTQYEAARYRDS